MDIKLIKENKKSNIYEVGDYKVKAKQCTGVFCLKNGDDKNPYYNSDIDDSELVEIRDAIILEVTNIKTGKKSQKRCYQGIIAVEEFAEDLKTKTQFKSIYDKIDS